MTIGKNVYIWNIDSIFNGDLNKIADQLVLGKFDSVILHSTNVGNWEIPKRIALAGLLKSLGIKVYLGAAIYGENASHEGLTAARLVNRYSLEGCVFDAEQTFDDKANPDSNGVRTLLDYKSETSKLAGWCYWATIQYFPRTKVAKAVSPYVDFFMPMTYWQGSTIGDAIWYLETYLAKWRAITDKPIYPIGRAYNGDGGLVNASAMLAFEARAKELGIDGLSWWVMDNALRLPGIWEALLKMSNDLEEENTKVYETYAKGLFLYEGCSITDKDALKGHIDFIIGEVGVGKTAKPKFKEWGELAKYLDVPFIAFVGSDPEPYIPMTYNPSMWGTAQTDITCNMIDKQRHYDSGTVLPIHAYMVDGSKYLTVDGKPIPDTWIGSIYSHTIAKVEERFKLHVFPFMKRETIFDQKVAPIPADGVTVGVLSKLPKVSTYMKAVVKVETKWGSYFVPSDAEGPKQPYSSGWDFWWYGALSNIPGILGGVPLFLYRGTPEELNKKVNFVPGGVVVDPGDDIPEEPPVKGAIGEKLYAVQEMLAALPSNRYVSIAITEIEKLQAFIEVYVE